MFCFVLFCSINLDRMPLCFHRPTHPTETTLGVLFFSLSREQDFPRNFNGNRHQNSYCQCYGKKKQSDNNFYFPWSVLLSTIENQMTSECSKLCSKTTRQRLIAFEHFDIISMVVKSTDHGKLLSICKIEHGKLLQFVKAGPLHYFSVI